MSKAICSFAGCANLRRVYGYCEKHAKLLKGTPETTRPSVEQRFWRKVSKSESCWEWLGSKNASGYGMFYMNKKTMNSSRAAYILLIGDVGDQEFVDHRCHNKACVNPTHLRVVTRKQNAENLIGANAVSKSGIRGVSWHRDARKWVVTATHNGIRHYGGLFEDKSEAETAAIELRLSLFTHSDGR